MRGVNPLKFSLDERGLEISLELEEWLRSWWGDSPNKMQPSGWFEVEGGNFLWAPEPAAAETIIELLL